MSDVHERIITLARIDGVVEDVAHSRDHVWAFLAVPNIEPLTGFSVSVRELGATPPIIGTVVMVELTLGVDEEFFLQPRLFLESTE